jgi:hypothetical protein
MSSREKVYSLGNCGLFDSSHDRNHMRKPLEPEDIAKFIKASGVANPVRVEFYRGAYYEATSVRIDETNGRRVEIRRGAYSEGFSVRVELGAPAIKVTVDQPKPVPAKKPKKRATPRAKRLKNSAIRKDGVILLKDQEREPGTAER